MSNNEKQLTIFDAASFSKLEPVVEWISWKQERPNDGHQIAVKMFGEVWAGQYFKNDGVDGIVEWSHGGAMEIEELGEESVWRVVNDEFRHPLCRHRASR